MAEVLTRVDQLAQKPRVVLFGLPGCGKTTLGRQLENYFGYAFYDTDDDLTAECLVACEKNLPFTTKMRRDWHDVINNRVSDLITDSPKIAVASPFSRDEYRREFLQQFPGFEFVYVQCPEPLRIERVIKRQQAIPGHPLTLDYAVECVQTFQAITIPFIAYSYVRASISKL
ncbi:AAA family ATPase [Candidatus Woesearchaeota archaeon]|nr:AAA family ATPase [Candidatus Woesearchaeota archaeon]